MDDGKIILRNYLRGKKIERGVETFMDAQAQAEKLGKLLADVIGSDFEDVAEEDLAAALRIVLKRAYDDSAAVAATVQRQMNRKLMLDIGVLRGEFDPAVADAVAEELAGKIVTAEFVTNLIQKNAIAAIDETIRKNAEAQENMGLSVHIVRDYSDVGLRAGTPYAEPCEWCMERCGEWDNYQDAYSAGCFERHPGCLCTIDYQVGRTHTRSEGSGWVDV